MKLRQAERITGYQMVLSDGPGKLCTLTALNGDGAIVAKATGKDEKTACRGIVGAVYVLHGLEALRDANVMCELCGSRDKLSRHHRVLRSHGRDDRTTNLQILCLKCHNKKHGVS